MFKKLFLIAIIISMIFGVSATVYDYGPKSYDDETGIITTQIKEGWNMIPWASPDINDRSCDFQHYGELFYSPTVNLYVTVALTGATLDYILTEEDMQALSSALPLDREQGYRYMSEESGAFFFYSFKDCTMKQDAWKANRGSLTPREFNVAANKIRGGWNFLTITPYMTEKPLSEWKGSCDISSINAWNAENQSWADPSNKPSLDIGGTSPREALVLDTSKNISKDLIGLTYAFEFEDDCQLNLS